MTAADVTGHLRQFEHLCRDRGALNIERMRPGITPERIRELEVAHGVRLPEDARAIWQWHNGTDPSNPPLFWGSGYWFPDLETAITMGRRDLDIRNSGDANTYPESAWVTLGGGSVSVVIDITDPERQSSPVYVNDPTSPVDDYPAVTLAERIGWWCWAIEHDVHRVTTAGSWQLDASKVPTGPARNLM